MRTYEVEITGKTSLILHNDSIDWADFMEAWKNDPDNKKTSKAGDDRSPAMRWIGCCYSDDKELVIPAPNIMKCIMEGAAMVPLPGGKNGKTFKSNTQSGMSCIEADWPLFINGSTIAWSEIIALKDEKDFSLHQEAAKKLGFMLLLKRAKIGQNKHIRVRPLFPIGWKIKGHFAVWDDQITQDSLNTILNYTETYKGLGDWRPSSPKSPGPHGQFEAKILD